MSQHKEISQVANLDEVLQRGTALSDMQNKSSDLLGFSKKYREDAKKINARSKWVCNASFVQCFNRTYKDYKNIL